MQKKKVDINRMHWNTLWNCMEHKVNTHPTQKAQIGIKRGFN